MNDNPDFWPMWGALATAASAIATFMAAFVALWQSKLTLKKNIKVELKNAHTLPDLKYYLEIDISNHGQKDIVIESWSWEFRDKGTVFIPNGLCRCIALGDIVTLPFVLKSENNLKIMLPIEHLANSLIKVVNEGHARYSDKLKVFVCDSTGERFYAKTRLKIATYVPQKYLQPREE